MEIDVNPIRNRVKSVGDEGNFVLLLSFLFLLDSVKQILFLFPSLPQIDE